MMKGKISEKISGNWFFFFFHTKRIKTVAKRKIKNICLKCVLSKKFNITRNFYPCNLLKLFSFFKENKYLNVYPASFETKFDDTEKKQIHIELNFLRIKNINLTL